MKKIVVRLKGGLGNQMFEYACGRSLQLDNSGYALVLDISEISDYGSKRQYALSNFSLPEGIEIISDTSNDKYSRVKNPFVRALQKVSPGLTYDIFKKKNVFIWDEANFKAIEIDDNKDVFINGYWQSSKYFSSHRDLLLSEFRFNNSFNDKSLAIRESICKCESVCVHIRLGDYLNNESYKVCDVDYYKRGIDCLNKSSGRKFFVFSDDINMAKSLLLNVEADLSFVDICSTEMVDMELMSLCKHFVLSNSSFSWWSQYLSINDNKTVIAPKKWKNDEIVTDIYEEGWVLL